MSMFSLDTILLPPDSIVVGRNIKNIRTVFPRDAMNELRESIQEEGLMQPLVVMPVEDDEGNEVFELVAGERRLRAIKMIQVDDPQFMGAGVPCLTFEGTLDSAKYINAVENVERENIDDIDLAEWVYRRCEIDGVSQTELAARMHKSNAWVSFRVTFHEKAADAVKEAVREKLISFSAAYHLAKNMSQEDQIKFINQQKKLNEKITVEQAENTGSDTVRVKRPGKGARNKMLKRADDLADKGSELGRGMALMLRWVDGVLPDSEVHEMVEFEEQK
jgi:ParB family chromosome partitioning protein